MSGESRLPTSGGDHTESSGDVPASVGSGHRTPDESTMALPSSDEAVPASSGETDLPRLEPGERLAGRFEVLRFIARGAMGAVYEAEDVMLRARVALKLIRGRIATDATAMERFRREVLLARRVSHPNVCRVYELYDATTAGGVPIHFLTMELLEGETLSRRIARQGHLTTQDALPLVRQMCEGLAAAHAEGVIHRDFKSSNVLLVPRREGQGDSTAPPTRVVITDFGIARAVEACGQETRDGPLTGGGAILGTPEYMAPEQVTGGAVTEASDIYALGVVLYEIVTGTLPFTGDTPLVSAARRLNEAPPRPEATTPGLDERWSGAILRCLAREPERRFRSPSEIPSELERQRRRWPRLATVNALVVAGLVIGLAVVAHIAHVAISGQKKQPHTAAVPTAPRPVIAILGLRDELASPELTWLSTAVSELLAHELAAAEASLRVVPGDRVARVRRSLGVSENDVADAKTRERMQALLAANVLTYGTLKPMAQNSASVGVSFQMVDALTGRLLAAVDEDLGIGANALADKVSSVAERLRETLGVSLSQEQLAALSAYRPRKLSAAKAYAEGVIALRKFEYANARSYFEAALTTDASFLNAQRRVVETWEGEGNRKKARDAAERIRSRPTHLTPTQLAETEATILSLGPEPAKGTEARKALFDATPDDVELGLAVIDVGPHKPANAMVLGVTPPKTAGAIISRLRELKAPTSDDIRLDLEEAEVAWRLGNPGRAKELLVRVQTRVRAVGARTELARALSVEGVMLFIGAQRGADALLPFQKAASLHEEVGELEWAAYVKSLRAIVVSNLFPTSTALRAFEENAALYRKLGNHLALRSVLVQAAEQMLISGDIELAANKLREALSESDAIGEPPGFEYSYQKGSLALSQADMEGVRNSIYMLRTEKSPSEETALWAEFVAFKAQDRLQEARETLERLRSSWETRGAPLPAFYCQRALCALACDEAHPLEALDCLARHPPPPGMGRSWTDSDVLARCRYLAGDLEGAERAAVEARAFAQQWGWYDVRVLGNAYLMRVRAARGETAKAIASLRTDLVEAERRSAKSLAFEVALALGDVELRAGRREGRARLLTLEQEARSREFFRIARLAREALDRYPVSAGARPVH
jgi:eukaryotic-like serine/threonine-protein kinase